MRRLCDHRDRDRDDVVTSPRVPGARRGREDRSPEPLSGAQSHGPFMFCLTTGSEPISVVLSRPGRGGHLSRHPQDAGTASTICAELPGCQGDAELCTGGTDSPGGPRTLGIAATVPIPQMKTLRPGGPSAEDTSLGRGGSGAQVRDTAAGEAVLGAGTHGRPLRRDSPGAGEGPSTEGVTDG